MGAGVKSLVPATTRVCDYSNRREMSANKFEVTIFNKTFKKYILTVHLEGKRHSNLLAVGDSMGDTLLHTFLSALGQTTLI